MKRIKVIIGVVFSFTFLGAMLIGGFTEASFSGSRMNSDQIFIPSDLDVVLDHTDGDPYFKLTNIAPGDSGSSEIVVSNTGSNDRAYMLRLSIEGNLVRGDNPLHIWIQDEKGNVLDPQLSRYLSAGTQDVLVIIWEWSQEAGNEYQDAVADLDISIVVEQVETINGSNNP